MACSASPLVETEACARERDAAGVVTVRSPRAARKAASTAPRRRPGRRANFPPDCFAYMLGFLAVIERPCVNRAVAPAASPFASRAGRDALPS